MDRRIYIVPILLLFAPFPSFSSWSSVARMYSEKSLTSSPEDSVWGILVWFGHLWRHQWLDRFRTDDDWQTDAKLAPMKATSPRQGRLPTNKHASLVCCWGKLIIPYLSYKHKSSLAQNVRDVTSIYNYIITERGLYQIRKKEKEKDELTSHRSSWDTTQVSFDVMVFCTLFYHKEETKDWEYQY